jgi:hypothetical protein
MIEEREPRKLALPDQKVFLLDKCVSVDGKVMTRICKRIYHANRINLLQTRTFKLKEYLETNHPNNYFIFSFYSLEQQLSNEHRALLELFTPGNRILGTSYLPNVPPSYESIIKLCGIALAFLAVEPENILVLTDDHSLKIPSIIFLATFIRFLGLFNSTLEAIDYLSKFIHLPNKASVKKHLIILNDIIVLEGRAKTNSILSLRQLVINTDKEIELEVYVDNQLEYTSTLKGSKRARLDNHLIFTIGQAIEVTGFLVLKFLNLQKSIYTLAGAVAIDPFSISSAGIYEIGEANFEYSNQLITSVELAFVKTDSTRNSYYERHFGSSLNLFNDHFSHHLNELLLETLLTQGFDKALTIYALINYNNDIHLAHEFLVKRTPVFSSRKASMSNQTLNSNEPAMNKIPTPDLSQIPNPVNPTTKLEISKEVGIPMAPPPPPLLSLRSPPSNINLIQIEEKIKSSLHLSEEKSPVSSNTELNENSLKIPPPPPPPPPLPFLKCIAKNVNIPPPPPPPPLKGNIPSGMPDPPPPPSLKTLSKSASTSSFDVQIKNNFHWDEIRDPQALTNSVWQEITEESIQLDLKKFESLFCMSASETKTLKASSSNTSLDSNGLNFLELRRANNISIGLAKILREFTAISEIFTKLENHESGVSFDILQTMQGILPTSEESSKARLYLKQCQSTDIVKNQAELFIIQAAKIGNLDSLCNLLIFENNFSNETNTLKRVFSQVSAQLKKLRESDSLKKILALVLEVGRLANYEYSKSSFQRTKERPTGFRIESLLKLKDTWSVDRNCNMLDFLVDSLLSSSQNKDLIDPLMKEFDEISSTRHYDMTMFEANYTQLLANYNECTQTHLKRASETFRSKYNLFVNSSIEELSALKDSFATFKKEWTAACNYFGESSLKCEELLNLLFTFFQQLDASKNSRKDRNRAALRRVQSMKATTSPSREENRTDKKDHHSDGER